MSHTPKILALGSTAGVSLMLLPTPALACPVCYGAIEGPAADAMNLAILALLGVTGLVLGGVAIFFVYLTKRAQTNQENKEWRTDPASAKI